MRLRHFSGGAPWSALGAESPENEFALADDPLPKGFRCRLGHLVPVDILHIAATIADEVVMLRAFGIEAGGTALNGHFTH